MTDKSDYFFFHIKQVYPNFTRPTELEAEIWAEMLEPYDFEDIRAGIKSCRAEETANQAPNPAKFRQYLFHHAPQVEKPALPVSPESHLMKEDIRAGRCRHLFPTYCKAVNHVLNIKLAELYPAAEFRNFSRGKRYRLAVDNGLFADFDKVLDLVAGEGVDNG